MPSICAASQDFKSQGVTVGTLHSPVDVNLSQAKQAAQLGGNFGLQRWG